MPRSQSKEGERFQIAILTPAMTGGLFALLTLLLVLFLNPSATSSATKAADDYRALTALLQTPEMKALRSQAGLSEGQEGQKSLAQVVSDGLAAYSIEYNRFPPATPKQIRPGLEEVKLSIDLKPSKLSSILQFIGLVRDAKKTIKVEGMNITRNQRAAADDEDSWTATVHFVDYVVKKG